MIRGFGVDIEYVDGAIFATSGAVVDPMAPALLGTYADAWSRSLAVEPDFNRIWFLYRDDLRTYRLSSFTSLGITQFPEISGWGLDLVRWAPGSLAFRTTGDQVVMLGSPFPETDGDGHADFADNCPDLFNPGQDECDLDGLGHPCDPYPDSPDKLLMCLQQTEADALLIEQLQEQLADTDGDGVLDTTDLCPATPVGPRVDLAGCSRRQFCAGWTDLLTCLAADWRNDEPLRANDCGWRNCCVPRGSLSR